MKAKSNDQDRHHDQHEGLIVGQMGHGEEQGRHHDADAAAGETAEKVSSTRPAVSTRQIFKSNGWLAIHGIAAGAVCGKDFSAPTR
jgi:hypothetical protein